MVMCDSAALRVFVGYLRVALITLCSVPSDLSHSCTSLPSVRSSSYWSCW